jgi:outer membrane immunogenic protein
MDCPKMSGDSGAASAISDAPRHCRWDVFRCAGFGDVFRRARLAAFALIAMAPVAAQAADMPEFLRGSYTPSYARWDGFYAGGQVGKTFASADFGNADNSLVSYMLANTELQSIVTNFTTLPNATTGTMSYGGFVGYNYQWDDVVMGAELNYNHMSINTGAQDTLGPILVPGANLPDGSTVLYNVTVASAASIAINNIATMRLRGGWAFDRFLPYGFVGLAIGQADVSRFATLAGSTKTTTSTATPPVVTTGPLLLPRDPQSQAQSGLIAYGFTVGLGVDVALVQNLFVRAEWEFIQFPNIDDFRVSTNSARLALGLKF